MLALCCTVMLVWSVSAQTTNTAPRALSLEEAHDIAIKNYPKIRIADLQASITKQSVREARAMFYPMVNGELTAVGTPNDQNNTLSAGTLQTSSIYPREADGVNISQLITDFGRTANLVSSSKLHSRAREQGALATREQILFAVDSAYFGALEAQSVLEVARQTVSTRQVIFDQISEMVKNSLKSDLDATFAEVDLEGGKLLLASAETDLQSSFNSLANLLGDRNTTNFGLAEMNFHTAAITNDWALIEEALSHRPDLAQVRLDRDASRKFFKAERDINYPTINAYAAAGNLPVHYSAIGDNYEAAGLNIHIPLFEGFLYTARKDKAQLEAQLADETVRNAENDAIRDVRAAILNENYAVKRVDLTTKLLASANKAYDLAHERYQVGSSSIVELSQAELAQTQAKIQQARARYQYQIRNSALNYQLGRTGTQP